MTSVPLFQFKSSGPSATQKFGKKLGALLPAGSVLALNGNLGSGKTQFTRGLALGLKVQSPKEVRSPTFTLIAEHDGPKPLCHADLYRLEGGEWSAIGLSEYWARGGWVVAVEWADKIPSGLPSGCLTLQFDILSPTRRLIRVFGESHWIKIVQKAAQP